MSRVGQSDRDLRYKSVTNIALLLLLLRGWLSCKSQSSFEKEGGGLAPASGRVAALFCRPWHHPVD